MLIWLWLLLKGGGQSHVSMRCEYRDGKYCEHFLKIYQSDPIIYHPNQNTFENEMVTNWKQCQ